jgi:hypothetical protein
MFNAKVKLTDLKVKSFVTVLDKAQQEQTHGGLSIIKGKKSNASQYSWGVTIIDIRAEESLTQMLSATIRRRKKN